MRQNTLLLIALVLLSRPLCGQYVSTDSLLLYEERIYAAANAKEKTEWLLKKFNYELGKNDFSAAAVNDAARINVAEIKDSLRCADFLWNAGLLAYFASDRKWAVEFMKNYFSFTADSSAPAMLLNVLLHNGWDTVEVSRSLQFLQGTDTSFNCLSCLNKVEQYERKGLKGYLFASSVLPGAGTMANGNIGKGFVSMLIFAGIAGGVTWLTLNGMYTSAVLWGVPMMMKFYPGNKRLTKKVFLKKEAARRKKMADTCRKQLSYVLKKYPLGFR